MLKGKNILLTGATGGLGQSLALQLADAGANLVLIGRDVQKLHSVCQHVLDRGVAACMIFNDFQAENSVDMVLQQALSFGAIDILINNAGVLDFTKFVEQTPTRIAHMMYINTIVPMLLTRALLPYLLKQNAGQIVNVGSIFGSIGFPHYVTYSASKFALRGFSQALRRELLDSSMSVTYIAPRAIKTPINQDAAVSMMRQTKTAMDDPQKVAGQIIAAIKQRKKEHYIGQPESFFAWLNGFCPDLVSHGLQKTTRMARLFIQSRMS